MQVRESNPSCPRRQFLKVSALGSAIASSPLFASANEPVFVNQTAQKKASKKTEKPPHRIQHLSLLTATPLKEMAAFYKTVLEMDVQLNDKSLVVEAGATQIDFSPAPDQSRPYYHFAFNIPENKILSARNWLGERTQLAVTPAQFRDRNFPNEVRPLGFWNAHSIYFRDPAGNILELICRHDMKNATKGEFRGEEILYASEIGLVANGSVNSLADEIMSTFQLPQYRGGGAGFRAIGDETGLIVLFSQGGTPIGASNGQTWRVFPTDVSIQANIELKTQRLPHSIRTSPEAQT